MFSRASLTGQHPRRANLVEAVFRHLAIGRPLPPHNGDQTCFVDVNGVLAVDVFRVVLVRFLNERT